MSSQDFTVRNTGGESTGPLRIAVSGTGFSQALCSGERLAPEASCTFTVNFSALSLGTVDGLLSVSASPGGSVGVTLSATGAAPATLSFVPDLSFGSRVDGGTSTQEISVTNLGGAPSGPLAVTLGGADAGQFSESNNCGFLAGGTSCTIDVTFAPTSPGSDTADVEISANPGSSGSVVLLGTGVAPFAVTVTTTMGSEASHTFFPGAHQVSVTLVGGTASTTDLLPGQPQTVYPNGACPGVPPAGHCTTSLAYNTGTAPGSSCSSYHATYTFTYSVTVSGAGVPTSTHKVLEPINVQWLCGYGLEQISIQQGNTLTFQAHGVPVTITPDVPYLTEWDLQTNPDQAGFTGSMIGLQVEVP
jgi:hypothetical protein